MQIDAADTILLAGDTSGALDANTNAGGRDAFVIKAGVVLNFQSCSEGEAKIWEGGNNMTP